MGSVSHSTGIIGLVLPLTSLQKPLLLSLSTKEIIGALSSMNPVTLLDSLIPIPREIRVPRNFALSFLVLVIRVFSIDRWSFKVDRKFFIVSFRDSTKDLEPHTPTSQSSAYRTYSIR